MQSISLFLGSHWGWAHRSGVETLPRLVVWKQPTDSLANGQSPQVWMGGMNFMAWPFLTVLCLDGLAGAGVAQATPPSCGLLEGDLGGLDGDGGEGGLDGDDAEGSYEFLVVDVL